MFCDEKIINAYLGQPNHGSDGNLFLDYYHDMALHLTDHFRIVLETANHYLSVETTGIFISEKAGPVQTLARYDECLDSYYHFDEDDSDDDPWVDYEYTLFVGEQIISVTPAGKTYTIEFTDFVLHVIPYANDNDIPEFSPPPYSRILGTERLIKRCACGGVGILDLDIVGDFGVRCDTCHKGTSANPCAHGAIEEWNNADNLAVIGDYPPEEFARLCHKPVDDIAIDSTRTEHIQFPFFCESIIVAIEGKNFCIQSSYIGRGNFGFSVDEFSNYNREPGAHKISSQRKKIRLTSEFNEGNVRELIFDVDGKLLRVISYYGRLMIRGFDDFID